MNWGENKWSMAQAPGSGVGASNVQTIGPNDTSINPGPTDNFGTSWAKPWTPLLPAGIVSPGKSSGSGFSSGAKTGIGIAGGLVGLAIIGAALNLIFRMLRRRGPMEHQQRLESKMSEQQQQHDPSPHYRYHAVGEKDAKQAFETSMGLPHEVDGQSEVPVVFELGIIDDRSIHFAVDSIMTVRCIVSDRL
ncbi:hypothetical protein ABVK25_009392 [Lepraria finkii]|uniref:Uncharacterized protein n=1 Tax=Lepraria finkii TaxID=1340010 RepID=A0ABR4B075_9LECA